MVENVVPNKIIRSDLPNRNEKVDRVGSNTIIAPRTMGDIIQEAIRKSVNSLDISPDLQKQIPSDVMKSITKELSKQLTPEQVKALMNQLPNNIGPITNTSDMKKQSGVNKFEKPVILH